MRSECKFAAVVMVGLLLAGAARADVVVPNAFAAAEGDNDNAFPLFAVQYGYPSQRYQQVYAANQFTAIGAGQYITDLKFRVSTANSGAYSDTDPSLRISLSVTSVAPDALSTTYASNITSPQQLVYNNSYSVSGTTSASNPRPFDIVVHLQTPFFYSPASGNLLLDASVGAGGTGTKLFVNSTFVSGDSVSRVSNGDVTATTGTADTVGIVTDFVTSTPEPASLSFLGMAAAGLLSRRRNRR